MQSLSMKAKPAILSVVFANPGIPVILIARPASLNIRLEKWRLYAPPRSFAVNLTYKLGCADKVALFS